MRSRFWEHYSLGELNNKEWEALCDGCGQCCLIREVEDSTVTVYGVACELLDIEQARCTDYANRLRRAPHCHELTPTSVPHYGWLPETCAYRRLHEGKPLPSWHPLLVGSRREMRERGITVSHYAVRPESIRKKRMARHVVARWTVATGREDCTLGSTACGAKTCGAKRSSRRARAGGRQSGPSRDPAASRQKRRAGRSSSSRP